MTRFGSLRRSGALITAGAAGMLLVGLSAGAASAHTPVWNVDCSTVTVDLTAYNGGVTNHVEVTIAGQSKPAVDQDFKSDFHWKGTLPAHSSPLDVHLVVTAGDSAQYNVDQTKQSEVCAGNQGSPTPTATPTPTAKPTKTAKPVPAPSSAAPSSSAAVAPAAASSSPAGQNLAETGSSSSTPLIAGGAAVVVVAGAGILWASRRRRTAQH